MKLKVSEYRRYPVSSLEKARPDWEIGKARLSLYLHKPTGKWFGLIRKASQLLQFEGDEPEAIIHEMRAETSSPPPSIRGFKGAVDRFLQIYPGGFQNSAFERGERGGKLEAGVSLQPLLQANFPEADAIALLKAARARLNRDGQSPLHMTESSDLDRAWAGSGGRLFLDALRAFGAGERSVGFRLMERALEGGRRSWPMVTLYPALLSPAADAILRPDAVKTFARSVKSVLAELYEPEPSEAQYETFLRLLDQTADEIAELSPRDYIDLSSFVWVATSYSADAEPRT